MRARPAAARDRAAGRASLMILSANGTRQGAMDRHSRHGRTWVPPAAVTSKATPQPGLGATSRPGRSPGTPNPERRGPARSPGRTPDPRPLAKRRQLQAAGISLAAFGALVALVASHPVGSAAGTTQPPMNAGLGGAGSGFETGPADQGQTAPFSGGSGLGVTPSIPRLRIGSGAPHLRSGGS